MQKRSDAQTDTSYHFSHRREWTTEDDLRLIEYSKRYSDGKIAELLGRTVPSIWSRRKRLRQEGMLL